MGTVAQGIVNFLEVQGIDRVFGVPGESYLHVLDALHDSKITFVNARQEGGAAMMAEATGKITRRPGVCMVTRGPGATNASAGVHIAQQDSTPMILFVGQIAREFVGRDAFQEVDYQQFFGGMAKAVISIEVPSRAQEYMERAWSLACSGRPGPVVVVLPEDVLGEQVGSEGVVAVVPPVPRGLLGNIDDAIKLINQANRPIAIVGEAGLGLDEAQVREAATSLGMPIAASFRRQGCVPADLPCYCGDVGLGINPQLKARIQEADLVLLLNAALSEVPSQSFTLLNHGQKVLQVLASPDEIGRYFQPDVALVGGGASFIDNVLPKLSTKHPHAVKSARAEYEEWSAGKISHPGDVQMPAVLGALKKHVPRAVMTNGAGNYASWLHRFWRYEFAAQVAPTSGSMGYGLPAAIATKIERPDATVICWAGDGCLQMTIQEMATATELELKIIVLVIDNGMYGTIRMHQENHFPGRVSGTNIHSTDFAAIAGAYWWAAHSVKQTSEFEPALVAALGTDGPSLIHLHLDPEAITPSTTLSSLRQAAIASQ